MPTVFQFGNDELQALRQDATLQRLLSYFDARTSEWSYPIKCMELFTIGVFFDLGAAFRNGQALDVLKLASQLPWDSFSDQRFLLALDLLGELATVSGTTQMPDELVQNWDAISSRAARLDPAYVAWEGLQRRYRKE
jgi:hypothetical protein